jgi:hypothetical protein
VAAEDSLLAARTLAAEGKYEEALREHIWFHDHALEENRHLSAVRLSYGIGAWAELGKVYPPARAALEQIRDRHTQSLLAGPRARDSFREVASINQCLECQEQTHTLFVQLVALDEKFAGKCAMAAQEALIHVKDFALAARFLGDPDAQVRESCAFLNWAIRRRRQRPYMPVPRVKADIQSHADAVNRILAVLAGCGRHNEVKRLRQLAADLVEAPAIRADVKAAITPGARPWYERGRPRRA